MSTLSRLAKKVRRIAFEIETVDNLNVSKVLEETVDDVKEIGEEIKEIILKKIAQVDVDTKLLDLYDSSTELLSSATRTNGILQRHSVSTTDLNNARNIVNSVMESIRDLDGFYKHHLNPKFNFHGITHQMLNSRMNELKSTYNKLRKTMIALWR